MRRMRTQSEKGRQKEKAESRNKGGGTERRPGGWVKGREGRPHEKEETL